MPDVRIAIDCRFAGYHAGLGRYTRELVNAMLALPSGDEFFLITDTASPAWLALHPPPPSVIACRARHYSLREQWEIPRILRNMKADMFLSPHFNIPFFCPVPFVATIHDFILHRFPNNASLLKRIAYRLLMHRCIRRAQHIVCPSTFVGAELAEYYGRAQAKKVLVIPEGVGPRFTPDAKKRVDVIRAQYGLNSPFLLYVGNAKQHKQVPLLLRTFAQAHIPECELVLITGGKEVQSLCLPDCVKILKDVSDEDLAVFYAGARALVSASCYEGFFLPGAEAIACGCPVIAFNCTAIPEVVGDAGRLIEAKNEQVFCAALRSIPSRPAAVARDWKLVAQETLALLKRAP